MLVLLTRSSLVVLSCCCLQACAEVTSLAAYLGVPHSMAGSNVGAQRGSIPALGVELLATLCELKQAFEAAQDGVAGLG